MAERLCASGHSEPLTHDYRDTFACFAVIKYRDKVNSRDGVRNSNGMANDNQITPMMTVGEVARILSAHVNTVRRWSNQGVIKPYRIGRRGDRRFIREDITRFLYELNKNKGDVRKAKLVCS